jgi:hypothetical protein
MANDPVDTTRPEILMAYCAGHRDGELPLLLISEQCAKLAARCDQVVAENLALKERIDALMEVLGYVVDNGGTILKTCVDPEKLPPNLPEAEARNWADITNWEDRWPQKPSADS